jgi:tryptophan-rich sensory protein
MLLFFSMGIARWLLLRSKADRIAQVALLGFLCLIYPLYTFGLCLEGVGLVGSIVTAVVAVWAVLRTLRESRMAAALIGLVVVWLGYASVALARTILAGTSR